MVILQMVGTPADRARRVARCVQPAGPIPSSGSPQAIRRRAVHAAGIPSSRDRGRGAPSLGHGPGSNGGTDRAHRPPMEADSNE